MPSKEAQTPVWQYWDEQSGAQSFNGREITLLTMPKQPPMTTMYRNSYPPPKLWWKHKEAPDHLNRPVPDFGHTSTHREQFVQHKIHGVHTHLAQYPQRQFHPKISADTTSRKDFPRHPLPPPRPSTADPRAWRPNTAPIGNTTMRSDYVPKTLPGAHLRPEPPPGKEVKFLGTTTTRESYHRPAEMPPPPAARKNPPHVVPVFDGTTEHRAKFERVELPPGAFGAIGLQVASKPYKHGGVGGQFEPMIRQGAPAPQVATKTFTTVVDDQGAASIIVVTKRNDRPDGLVLGYFSMAGLKRGVPAGIPKVVVTLKLNSERTLTASAVYVQGNKTKALQFTSGKGGPRLRSVTAPDEVPDDF